MTVVHPQQHVRLSLAYDGDSFKDEVWTEPMRVALLRTFVTLLALVFGTAAAAQKDPYVGDVPMSPKKTLLENLSASPIHTEFVKAAHGAQLDQTLTSGGNYTVFAPTDDAFRQPKASAALTGASSAELVKYHMVEGRLTSKQLTKRVKKGHGSLVLQTLAGQPLTVKRYGSVLVLTDTKGGTATLITPDVRSKDGAFHVIDCVLVP